MTSLTRALEYFENRDGYVIEAAMIVYVLTFYIDSESVQSCIRNQAIQIHTSNLKFLFLEIYNHVIV